MNLDLTDTNDGLAAKERHLLTLMRRRFSRPVLAAWETDMGGEDAADRLGTLLLCAALLLTRPPALPWADVEPVLNGKEAGSPETRRCLTRAGRAMRLLETVLGVRGMLAGRS